jgi:uncharacterized protein (UPF0332 family)
MSESEILLLLNKAQNTHRASILLLENTLIESAVGRAYYTMFYIAQAFLLSKNLSFSSHKAVISNFGQEFAKTKKIPIEYHRFLIDAQIKRNEADYDINPSFSADEVREIINKAEQMLNFAILYFDKNNN